jgi:hypothetical protein
MFCPDMPMVPLQPGVQRRPDRAHTLCPQSQVVLERLKETTDFSPQKVNGLDVQEYG